MFWKENFEEINFIGKVGSESNFSSILGAILKYKAADVCGWTKKFLNYLIDCSALDFIKNLKKGCKSLWSLLFEIYLKCLHRKSRDHLLWGVTIKKVVCTLLSSRVQLTLPRAPKVLSFLEGWLKFYRRELSKVIDVKFCFLLVLGIFAKAAKYFNNVLRD